MYKCSGVLEYGPGTRVVAWLDPEIMNYYYRLIPKCKYATKQRHPTHVTVIRDRWELPINDSAWKKYDGKMVYIEYASGIQYKDPYFFLNAYSDDLVNLRLELGLPAYRITPFMEFDSFHITIANTKHA